jgi:HprK-related kinase B
MALAVVERGYRFVTNDRLLVRPLNGRVEMVGVPKRPRVNPGTLMRLSRLTPVASPSDLRRYRRLSPDELWTVEEKWDVDVDAIFGQGTFQLAGRLDAVYMLRWHPREAAGWQVHQLEPAERKTSLAGMAKTVGVYDLHPPAPTEQQMLLDTIADTIPIYEVTGRVDVMALRSYLLEHPAHTPAVS